MDHEIAEKQIPRVLIAGTGSGCGKTTLVCAVLQALVNRGLKTGAFKCGPDYIDPMFHARITGHASYNLDGFFCDADTLRYLMSLHGEENDINIIEGVMGYYDGAGLDTDVASTYDISVKTKSPVILVIGARGASASVLAVLHGFLTWRKDAPVCGVILNQCTPMTYQVLARKIEEAFQGRVKPLGYMPVMTDCSLESRHLGLVTADEVADLKEKLRLLAEQAARSIDLEGIVSIARSAPALPAVPAPLPGLQADTRGNNLRIAVARDKAFCFYYEDNLELLQKLGAQLVYFSPIADSHLPEDIRGLYLGGGYPELYAEDLSRNTSMCSSVRNALESHLPCIAECGGLMYLTQWIRLKEPEGCSAYPMAGVIDGASFNTGKLQRFGYVTLTADTDNMLCRKGEQIRAHEFHYWDSDNTGNGFTARKLSGKSWQCVHASDCLYAGYPHFHFYAQPSFAVKFLEACRNYAAGAEKDNDREG